MKRAIKSARKLKIRFLFLGNFLWNPSNLKSAHKFNDFSNFRLNTTTSLPNHPPPIIFSFKGIFIIFCVSFKCETIVKISDFQENGDFPKNLLVKTFPIKISCAAFEMTSCCSAIIKVGSRSFCGLQWETSSPSVYISGNFRDDLQAHFPRVRLLLGSPSRGKIIQETFNQTISCLHKSGAV